MTRDHRVTTRRRVPMTRVALTSLAVTSRRAGARYLLDPIRARSSRSICWTPDFMGFGNVLHLLQWAANQRWHGNDVRIRTTGALEPWLPVFPELAELCVDQRDARLWDRRVAPWSVEGRQAMGEQLHRGEAALDPDDPYLHFLETFLAPGARRHGFVLQSTDHLTINVRRGDYYSDPDNRRSFGFDVAGYLDVAVRASIDRDGPVATISVISDDPGWCREHLGFLHPLADVDFRVAGPVPAFFELVGSRRLVMTNSTFSYWAARLGVLVRDGGPEGVWAPRFFDRNRDDPGIIDERWSIIESIPGGWDEKDVE